MAGDLANRALMSAVVAGAVFAGCATPESEPGVEAPGSLFLGGAHFRWYGDGLVEAEGYLINTRTWELNIDAFRVVGSLAGTGASETVDQVSPSGLRWQPAEVRKWSASFEGVKEEPLQLVVSVYDTPSMGDYLPWRYVSHCLTPHYEPSSGCTFPTLEDAKLTPTIEHALQPNLLRCCNWTSPQIDVFDIVCDLLNAQRVCRASLWNFGNTTQDLDGSAAVRTRNPDGTPGSDESTFSIAIGGPLGPGETRIVEFALDPLLFGMAATPTTTYEIDVRVASAVVPRSIANESAVLRWSVPD